MIIDKLKFSLSILTLVLFHSPYAQDNNKDVVESANYLIEQAKTIISEEMSCEDLGLAKIYLSTYQEIYKRNSEILKDKQSALDMIDNSIQSNCFNFGRGSFESGMIVVTSQGGSINAKQVKIPATYLPTLFMDEASKLSYFASLPKSEQSTIISLEQNKEITDAITELKNIEGTILIEKLKQN